MMTRSKCVSMVLAAALGFGNLVGERALAHNVDTAHPPDGIGVEEPGYVDGEGSGESPVIRVYKDSNAWFGENRDHSTLVALGKVLGEDYFVHPLSALSAPIPEETAVVLLTSNGEGLASAVDAQNSAAAQTHLEAFVRAGGVLIVDMGDNVADGGFLAPGALGTPSYIFPLPCYDATLAPAAYGPDATLGTLDDHPAVLGPDGLPVTADDLDDWVIDLETGCSVAHGHLEDGITLPADATVLMTAPFGGSARPILAEYCLDAGRVVLDTITKEFIAQQGPEGYGDGPTHFMRNLFSYALSGEATQHCALPVGVDVLPRACPNTLDLRDRSLTVAIVGTDDLDVEQVDPSTLTLVGVGPIHFSYGDLVAPFEPFLGKEDCSDCGMDGADGFVDLILEFDNRAIREAIRANLGAAGSECLALPLEGRLLDGRQIVGEDVVVVARPEK